MVEIIVREFQESDAEAAKELFVRGKVEYENYSQETRWLTTMFANDKASPDGDMSNIFQHYMESGDDRRCFWVAEVQETGEIVGSIATTVCTYTNINPSGEPIAPNRYSFIHDHFKTIFKVTECLELVRLTVSEKYHRRGIGQMLLNAVETHALKLGFQTIYLTTLTEMHGAYNFYTKHNFTLLVKELVNTSVLPNFEHGSYDFEVAHFIRDIVRC
jgi:GNAT superfamily N-acetyltransferase